MNVKKAVKRIVALAAGTTMVSATIMGAMAYDLGDYPEPFVKNGLFNGKIVVGEKAEVSDVIGAIDIAASLQAAAKTPVAAEGSTATVSVTGGVQLKSSSTDLHYGDIISSVNSGKYDVDEFPELLADGIVEDDDGTEFDYEQSINVSTSVIGFGQDDDYGDDPVFYVDLAAGGDTYLYFKVVFSPDSLNATELEDSESIEMFGKTYTFDPNHDLGDDLTLYGSDVTVTVTQNEPVTIQSEGDEYTIEILGGNTGDSSAIIRVTSGGTSETKTLIAGNSKKMAGLDVFVEDVFISDIGGDTISVSIFVGSEKVIIVDSAADADCDDAAYKEITIGSDDDTNVEACIKSSETDVGDIEGLYFRVNPTDFNNEATDDDWAWMVEDAVFEVPLFDFELTFGGLSPALDDRPMVELTRKSDLYTLAFTNNADDKYSIEFVQSDGADLSYGYDGDFKGAAVLAAADMVEDNIFILESSGSADLDDIDTYLLEVTDINDDDDEVTLKELGSGVSKTYSLTKEILDTGVTIDAIGAGNFSLSAVTKERVIAKGGLSITWEDGNFTSGALGWGEVFFLEEADDLIDVVAASTVMANMTASATDDIDMYDASWTSAVSTAAVADTDSNVKYGISEYGTWFVQDIDDESDYLKVYYSNVETDFLVFLNGPDAVVVTSGSSSGSAYVLNEMVVGQIAIYDSEAMSMIGKTPIIAVGGPCANTVSMKLMGDPEVCGTGFTEGKAKIKYWDSKMALLVAGYSGEDTTGAARVIAGYADYELSGDEVEVVTTDLKNLEVKVVG